MTPVKIGDATIHHGDVRAVLATLTSESVQTVVTSPPYWGLRDYGVEGQIGLEATPEEFIATMVAVFSEVRRVLRSDGTCWINIGDSYAGSWGAQSRGGAPSKSSTLQGNGHVGGGPKVNALSAVQVAAAPKTTGTGSMSRTPQCKPKDLVGIPWMLAFALRADGWYLRQDIIWHKPNPMPESVRDRCTKAHEYIFLLTKSERYHYDIDAIKERSSENTHARLPGNRSHKGTTAYEEGAGEHRTKAGLVAYAERKRAESGSGTKNNASFDEAMAVMPDTRNKRSVWTVASEPFSGAHFATFPTKLIEPCILAGAAPGDVVLDPFHGAGTTGMVALSHGRQYVGIELNADYIAMSVPRLESAGAQGRLFA